MTTAYIHTDGRITLGLNKKPFFVIEEGKQPSPESGLTRNDYEVRKPSKHDPMVTHYQYGGSYEECIAFVMGYCQHAQVNVVDLNKTPLYKASK